MADAQSLLDPADEDNLNRVRTLLKFASCRGQNVRGGAAALDKDKRSPKAAERWQQLFRKYDADGSGCLSIDEVKKIIRRDLRLPERVLNDRDLKMIFRAIDEDGNGTLEFNEFLQYVQKGDPDNRSTTEVLRQVGRAARLALRRNHMRWDGEELLQLFENFDDGQPGVDFNKEQGLGPDEMRRFFRRALNVSTHECSDRNLKVAFQALDTDGSKRLSADEFIDFVRFFASPEGDKEQAKAKEGMGCSLIGGMRGVLPPGRKHQRPGIFSGDPNSMVPFNCTGREHPPRTRSAMRSQSEPVLRSTTALPDIAGTPGAAKSQDKDVFDKLAAGKRRTSVSVVAEMRKSLTVAMINNPLMQLDNTNSAAPGSSQPSSPTSPSKPSIAAASPRKSVDASAASPGDSGQSPKDSKSTPKRRSNGVPGQDSNQGYVVIKGVDALNRVEKRLYAAGIDVRGGLYRAQSTL
eukprot:gnl/TRDRNA2_/TRDRNA2_182803_c0_seq1.p1 gnl/TRDRNA2_/TRDRNA2_182803_c0~~gnl/TRDRNA2_/TRDRNA2_182803_c0_seq1.p1  ORF type:complete len:510 (-),score=94.63 gnl/TRDRNA2_/TRDRNA2_182803_c0_seq1:96-1487(-)